MRTLAALGLILPLLAASPAPARAEAPPPARAEAAAVRADATRSALRSGWFGRALSLELHLDRAAPFRVFTLDGPPRLVIDFERLDWTGFDPAAFGAWDLRVGRIALGWSRLVLALPRPLALASAELRPDPPGVMLDVRLKAAAADDFAAASGAPPGVWPAGAARAALAEARGAGAITVAIDPGHGGIDPGAVYAGVREKDVALAFSRALRDALVAAGFRVLLTREADDFLPLDDRVAAGRRGGADLFLSIHSNAIDDPDISGAIAFTLSERGSTRAAAERARIENRADTVAGLAFPADDPVGAVLSEIAQVETDARSERLATALVAALAPSVGVAPGFPRQSANFRVLGAPDIPSVLLELGFLSNPGDRAEMTSPAWRARAAAAVRDGLEAWLSEDRGLARLNR